MKIWEGERYLYMQSSYELFICRSTLDLELVLNACKNILAIPIKLVIRKMETEKNNLNFYNRFFFFYFFC